MSFNFYQARDRIVQNLGRTQPDNSILFSTDRLKTYAKFSDVFSPLGEHRNIIYQDFYEELDENQKNNNNTIYCIIDGKATLGIDYNYTVGMCINPNSNSLVVITDKAI